MPHIATQSGYCFMRFDVDTSGRTFNVDAYKCSDDMFANAAADSVRAWLYEPKLENGQPVVSKGLKTKVTFRLSDEDGEMIEEPLPIDKNINDILTENQKAKLTSKMPKSVLQLSKLPTPNFCCVKYDVSQTGKAFNADVVTCSDFELLDDATAFIRSMKFTSANYSGEKVSSGGYTMLIKFFDLNKIYPDAPIRMLPTIGPGADKGKICQFNY